jgi:hypothetical protein
MPTVTLLVEFAMTIDMAVVVVFDVEFPTDMVLLLVVTVLPEPSAITKVFVAVLNVSPAVPPKTPELLN